MKGEEKAIDTLSVRILYAPQPSKRKKIKTKQWKTKWNQQHAWEDYKALARLLKPASPSHQDRSTEIMRVE